MTSSAADHAADRATSREADRTLPSQNETIANHQTSTAEPSVAPTGQSGEMEKAAAPGPTTLADASAPLPSIETENHDDDTVMRDAGESQSVTVEHGVAGSVQEATSQSVQPATDEQAPPTTPIKRSGSNRPEATETRNDNTASAQADASSSLQSQTVQIKQEDADTDMSLTHTVDPQVAGASQPPNQPFTPYRGNGFNQNQTPNNARSNMGLTPIHPNGALNPDVMNLMQVLQGMHEATVPSVTHVTPSQMMKQPLPDLADAAIPQPDFGESSLQQEAKAAMELGSFAKLEFDDSTFQMTTYAVIIGRDMKAIRTAKAEAAKQAAYEKKCADAKRLGLPMPEAPKKYSKSFISEEGGMLGPGSDSNDSNRPTKRRKTNSVGSAERKPQVQETEDNTMINRQYMNHTSGAAPVNLNSLRPDPEYIPTIPIHSPGPDFAAKTKAISREHVKIAYNKKTGVFEAFPMHTNGFFHNDSHCSEGKVILRCGSRLQIKDVPFTFIIPGVERGKTGAEKKPADPKKTGGKQMSFDFSHTGAVMNDTSEDDLSSLASATPPAPEPDFGNDEEVEETPNPPEPTKTEPEKAQSSSAPPPEPVEDFPMADAEEPAVAQPQPPPQLVLPQPQLEQVQQVPPPLPVDEEGNEYYGPQLPPKKRGPGRPPKNGHTSRREQKEIDRARRAQEEEARKTLPQPAPLEPPPKRKVGRPRKHPLPENAEGAMGEKRKYKPRAPKADGEGSDAERRAKEKKEKRARAKSPPLALNIQDFTQEQLQKPNKNYGQLLEETLDAHPEGLSLKQIYSRICKTWPWYYFYTETKGWESSVRHNLIGNEAFRKEDTTGLWFRVPGIPLDQGKKRKQTSPDRAMAAGQYGYGYGYPNQHMAQQGQYPPGQMPMYQNMQYGQQQMQPGQQMQQGMAQQGHVQQGQPMQAQQQGQQQLPQQQAGYGQQQQMQPRPQVPGQQPQQQMQQQGQQQYNPAYAPRQPMPAQGQQQNGQMTQPNQQAAQQGQHIAPAINGSSSASVPQPQGSGQAQAGAPPVQQGTPGAQQSPAPNGATPASSSNARYVIDPRALQALVKLKNGLIGSLANARSPNSEAIVYSGLNICIGLRKQGTENKKMEDICVKGFTRVVAGFNKNGGTSAAGSAGSPPADGDTDAATIFEDPKVLSTLTGFIDVTSKALYNKLGKAKAEAVALSAVNRTLGFASASIANLMTSVSTPDAEGSAAPANSSEVSIEGLEQYLMKSVTGMIERMSLKVANPTT